MPQHPNWAVAVVFVLAFGESLAFVSLILPFWAMLVAIGAIIGGTNHLNFWVIVAAAASGAALGDWLSYWLGYHYHERIQQHVAAQQLSEPDRERPRVLSQVGCVGDCARPASRGRCAPACRSRRASHRCRSCSSRFANWTSAFLWAFVLLSPGAFGMKWWFEYFT